MVEKKGSENNFGTFFIGKNLGEVFISGKIFSNSDVFLWVLFKKLLFAG